MYPIPRPFATGATGLMTEGEIQAMLMLSMSEELWERRQGTSDFATVEATRKLNVKVK